MRVIPTRSGVRYNLDLPRASDTNELDIAYTLSALPRHGGRTDGFFSIAEYSVWLSRSMATPEGKLWALLIEAPKAYLPHHQSPLLKGIENPGWERDYNVVLGCICQYYGLRVEDMPAEIPLGRSRMLATEIKQLKLWADDFPEVEGVEPLDLTFLKLQPNAAVYYYLEQMLAVAMPGSENAARIAAGLASLPERPTKRVPVTAPEAPKPPPVAVEQGQPATPYVSTLPADQPEESADDAQPVEPPKAVPRRRLSE